MAPGTRRTAARKGFTVIELLLVVAMIAILGSMLLAAVMAMRAGAKKRQTEILLQQLVAAIETMKSDYGYSRALGVDKDGNVLPASDLDNIDLGKELNPKSPFWNPPPDKDMDILLNKRLKTYYEVHKHQVVANEFRDPFGWPVKYRVELMSEDVDGNNRLEHYAKEYLVSYGPDGSEGTDDDLVFYFPRTVFLGEDD
ncbi:MAG TPA: type II secretion system protein [Planctomycetes bacterium]|nr:type II secretion system protein [Planctomycetota bacterium]